jgi:hypothetical protein
MDSVVLLWHISEVKGEEDSIFIGVYRTEDDAKSAIERLKDKSGFAGKVDGFFYEQYELNVDHWTEGFKLV